MNEATNVSQTNYLTGGFQYKNNVLQFFPHAEGYVKYDQGDYSYVFNYTDHLGNVRVSYSDIDGNGVLGDELQQYCPPQVGRNPPPCEDHIVSAILEENHYYPFGLKHSGYNMDNSQPYFDAYYLLTYGEFNFNSRKKLSYYFLIKAYEKGNQDAISVVLYKKHENENIVINSDYYKNIIISSNDVLPCELRNYFNN